MHPRFAEIVEYLETTRAALLARAAELPDGAGARRGDADGWSAAEVLDHLRRTESGIARLLGKLLERAGAESLGAESEEGSVMASLDRFRIPEMRRPIEAPDYLRPDPAATIEGSLAALRETREALLDVVRRADGRAVGTLSAPHPVLGPLDFYQWVLFVGQHEARHTAQLTGGAGRVAGEARP
jgi:hypothetical protein